MMRTCVTGPHGESGDDLSKKVADANKQSEWNAQLKGGGR